MQDAGNALLAAAVDSADRFVVYKVEADWNRNGLYNHALSDLTEVIKSLQVDRDVTGALPPETTILEGFYAAQMTVRLGGTRTKAGDAYSIAEQLAPWRTDMALYGVAKAGVSIRAFVGHLLSDGTTSTPQQFQGKISECKVDSATRTVNLTCSDPSDGMRPSVTLPIFALPPGSATSANLNLQLRSNSQWVIDFILRQNGYYMSPPEHAKTFFSATMHGAPIPNRGHQARFWIGEGSVGESAPVTVPGRPGWGLGYGPSNAYWYGVVEARSNFTTYSPVVGQTLCMQAQVDTTYAAQQVPGQTGNIVSYSSGPGFLMGNAFVLAVNASRQIILTAYTDAVLKYTVTGPTLGTGWQDVWCEIELGGLGGTLASSQVRFPGLDVAFAFTTLSSAPGVVTYPYIHLYNQMPSHDIQISDRTGLATGVTRYNPGTWVPQADIDSGLNDMTGLPIRRNEDSWELLKEVVAAEFGVVGFTEAGRPFFKNRETLRRSSLTAAKTSDRYRVVTNLGLSERAESVRNNIVSEYAPRYMNGPLDRADVWDVIFAAKSPTDIQLPTGQFTMDFVLDEPGAWVESITMPTLYTTAQWNDPANDIGTRHGFAVCRTDTGAEVTSGVSVIQVLPLSPQGIKKDDVIRVLFNNTINFPVQLRTTDNRPAFRLRGLKFYNGPSIDQSFTRAGSITRYGERVLPIQRSDWLQMSATVQRISFSLLNDLQDPVPIVDQLDQVGDCRLQLADTMQLEDQGGLGGPVLVSVAGISRTLGVSGDGQAKLIDALNVRPFAAPGKWILGHSTWSVLGTTTQI